MKFLEDIIRLHGNLAITIMVLTLLTELVLVLFLVIAFLALLLKKLLTFLMLLAVGVIRNMVASMTPLKKVLYSPLRMITVLKTTF
ncbi:hypothetical protein C1645_788790 [Glomus cerebriforme]|uniref:Uncharacterized protein n=1 Tax=Glomus cerebriforme TaxID=658196 RepID=A0A397S9P3_9GLOM|nr:hypothetical protein C1645_788790 [Glomus cerebriforme]